MDALILSCGTGGGHNAAATAIKEELQHRGHNVLMFNPYKLHSGSLSARIDKTYIAVAQRAPRLFGMIYALGNLYRRLPFRSPVYFLNRRMADTVQSYLQAHPVDVVIMTHLFPAEILTGMQDFGMPIPKTIFVATDYTCIPFTEECACDAYIIPSEKLKEEFEMRGIPAARIHSFGIPVSKGFRSDISKEAAKKALGLDADKQYFLISGGSIGASKLNMALKILFELIKDTNIRLIVICGSNKPLQKKLEKRYGSEAIIIGYTEEMPLYLRACDLYFTKPGGLSTTEAAVAEEPLILLPPIPGCETRNLRFFTQNGLAVSTKLSPKELRKKIACLQNVKKCKKMLQRQAEEIHKDATKQICDLAEKIV